MPRVYDSLALAASSHARSSENRLTEVLGTVLQSHIGFVNVVLDRCGLHVAERVNVWSQQTLGPNGRPDLILRGDGAHGRSVVYFEHKMPVQGAPWETGQPSKYLRSLRAEIVGGRDGRLLVIAGVTAAELRVRKRVRRASSSTTSATETVQQVRRAVQAKDRPLMEYATWNEIAGWAFEAGEKECGSGRDWLVEAAKPSCSAAQRLLAELIWYLEGEGYGMARALGPDLIAQAPAAFAFMESIESLTNEVSDRVTAKEAGIGLQCVRGTSDTFKPPESCWLARWNARIYIGWDQAKEVSTEATDNLMPEDLVFVVGVDTAKAEYEALERKALWEDQIREAGLSVDSGTPLAVFDPRSLSEATTLDQQGALLGGWAAEQIKTIIGLKPGRRPPNPGREEKKRARRRLGRR